jgi:TIR domain
MRMREQPAGTDHCPLLVQSISRTRRRPRCSSHVEREGRHDRDRASKDMARTVGADPWRAAIERTLERSEVLVVLVSGASMASAEVRYELNRYRPLGRPVIPILLDDAGEA